MAARGGSPGCPVRLSTASLVAVPLLAWAAAAAALGVDQGPLHQWPWLWALAAPQQWSIIYTGLCLNVVFMLILRSLPGSTAASCGPTTPSACTVEEPEPQALARRSDSSNPSALWWQCLCCGRTDGEEVGCEPRRPGVAGPRAPGDPPVGPSEPLWVRSDGHIHPKFCGLRLQEPLGRLPDLHRFAADGDSACVPDHWEYLLQCTPEERQLCRELRTRLADCPGPKDPVTMLRFLRARRARLDAAVQMYVSAMRWRKETGFERGFRANTLDDSLDRRLDEYWPPTALLGRDLEGDPIYWNRLGLGNMAFLTQAPVDVLVRHEVYTITRIMQAMEEQSRRVGRPVTYMTVVVDLADVGTQHLNMSAIAKYKICVRVMEDNFPELVKRIIIVRAPRIASTLWNLAAHFFDEGTRAKIRFADSGRPFDTLTQYIDGKWVPEALGGSHRIGSSAFCEPIIPAPDGPPPPELMRDLAKSVAR